MKSVPALATLALLLALALAVPLAGAQAPPPPMPERSPGSPVVDAGTLVVSQNGKPVRVEEFEFQRLSDTLAIRAASHPVGAPGEPARPPDKTMVLLCGPYDYAMGTYWSTLSAGPDTLKRGIDVSDTLYTAWRDLDRQGIAEAKVLPPGRLYILDPPLFTTFTIIARSLQGKACDHRPINVLVLGARDSVVAATVNDAGNETIRWGGRPVVARKLVVADERTTFTGWVSQDGRLLRLEQPQSAIRVERQPPPLKPRGSQPR